MKRKKYGEKQFELCSFESSPSEIYNNAVPCICRVKAFKIYCCLYSCISPG